jgi:hypothetical protein
MYVMLKENLPDKDGRSRGLQVLNDKGRFNVKVSVSSPVLFAHGHKGIRRSRTFEIGSP